VTKKKVHDIRRETREIPAAESVKERFSLTSPKGATFEVLRTDQCDEYEESPKQPPSRRRRSKRSPSGGQ
jgi:hypothetical protein